MDNLNNIEEVANYIVSDGKGILAADESNPTCGKRFDSIGVESNEQNRRDYREMLFRSAGMKGNIGGVILFDETIRQKAEDGTPLINIILDQGALPGIKVDQGLKPIGESEESLTQGLQGLDERLKEYYSLGAKFTKWRAVIKVGHSLPSEEAIVSNMEALAEYAKLVQDNNMVPMVEPEVLMDGDHSIDQCFDATSRSLECLFNLLKGKGVNVKGTILKPNMVTSGSESTNKADVDEVANQTIKCLKMHVPDDLPGITFLSGGQSDLDSTAHLNAMNAMYEDMPWNLTFSYGRALQQDALNTWKGVNRKEAQEAFLNRAKNNSLASMGMCSETINQ